MKTSDSIRQSDTVGLNAIKDKNQSLDSNKNTLPDLRFKPDMQQPYSP